MKHFLARFASKITSVLSGLDRMVIRGHLRRLMMPDGMLYLLCQKKLRLLDFGDFAEASTQKLKEASLREAHRRRRPIVYLPSSQTSKEDTARRLLAEHPVREGLVCVLSSIEPCMSFEYHRSKNPKERGLRLVPRKCLYLYHYYKHPQLGFLNARIQTWFPFNIQICLNGREWLERQMLARGYRDFRKQDNCFTHVGDWKLAQRLLDRQLKVQWTPILDEIAGWLDPVHEEIFPEDHMHYYWSVHQAEWATDVCFEGRQTLAEIYPQMVRLAMSGFSSPDVMRFLGQKVHGNFTGEIVSSFKDRPEGIRVRHSVRANSIKMYDKNGLLRVETTVHDPAHLMVYRPREGDPDGELGWRPLRKGVADFWRWAEVSQRSNERYLDALSTIGDHTPLQDLLDPVTRPAFLHGRRVRGLRPWDPTDLQLLRAVNHGEFVITGLRNRDLVQLLYPAPTKDDRERRRRSARVSRLLRLLRAHGLLRRIPKTHRYQVTQKGRTTINAVLAASAAPVEKLLQAA